MTGEDLYNVWRTAMRKQGVGCDRWDELEAADVRAWEVVAEKVAEENDG